MRHKQMYKPVLPVLKKLMAAETLERYLHTRYVGQKRFSRRGESAIPALDTLTKRLRAQGVEEMVIGMAHRGRLNVLVNLLNKDPAQLFAEFEGKQTIGSGSGDGNTTWGIPVIWKHLPVRCMWRWRITPTSGDRESGGAGQVRARQERRGEDGQAKVVGVLIHGIPRWAASASTKPRLTDRRLRATALAVRYIW